MLDKIFDKKNTVEYSEQEENLSFDSSDATDEDVVLNLSSLDPDGEKKVPKNDAAFDREQEGAEDYTVSACGQKDGDPEVVCKETLERLVSGELGVDKGVEILKKLAEGGFSDAWVYLGQIYAENEAAYDPILAFECFSNAAKADVADGCFLLGSCYADGFGCEKNEESAVDCFLTGAEKDHVGCIRALGICRELGIGCRIDYEMAVALYSRVAELGDAEAINNLGGCYFYGHGVTQNKQYAVELYERAAMLGNSNAECRLGICCELGEGCEKDLARAFGCYQRAAAAGNSTAQYRLAICYDKGLGTEQNFALAFEAYSAAARAGYAQAMYETGVKCRHGKGTRKDHDMAYRMFSMAAEAGIPAAEYEVGNCYFEGAGTVRNRELAYLRYLNAFDMDNTNAKAAFKIGLCNLKGLGTKKDEKAAFEWFCLGDAHGSRSAAYMMGECYFFGVGVEENRARAVECFERSIEYAYEYKDRTVPALLALAQCLERGYGTERDSRRALTVYKQAADFGSEEAMYRAGCAIMAGAGRRPEYAAARIYILRAARKGYVPAMTMMGVFADEGKGIPRNLRDAKQWYLKAVNADADNRLKLYEFPERTLGEAQVKKEAAIEARYRLGMLTARTEPTAQSYISSIEHIALAASLGHEGAQTEMSKIYVHGGDLKSYFESPFSREDALFENGEAIPSKDVLSAAMNKLGDAMYDGKSMVKKNEAAAARCYKIAASLGNTEACYNYGWCLRHGVGVYENDAEAIKWLKLAADKGNSNAAYSYGLCCEEGAGSGVKNKREALFYYRIAAAAGHAEAAKRYLMLTSK
ncbi:MAG: sel1 repeat family protein [Ruminococcaceae bacterium]|nr:sel1 repeat family protein [Oscillospiraceae bacterium]